MKNEKVCISKSIAFVAAIVAVLLGVVLFANYMNSQSLGTDSKAGTASCSPASSNIDPANNCEMKLPVTDTFEDGSTHKSTKDYTGRKCDVAAGATTGTLVNDYTNCIPTVRCNFGGVTYAKWDSSGNVHDATDSDNCVMNAAGSKIGFKCVTTTDPTSTNIIAARAQQDSACAGPAKEKKCSFGGQEITDVSAPLKYVDATRAGRTYKCIQKDDGTGTFANTGYKCKTDNAGVLIASGSVSDATACPLPAKAAKCLYGGNEITDASTPFKYTPGTFCITDASGNNTGYKCQDDGATPAVMVGGSAYADKTKCPLTSAAKQCMYGGQAVTDTSTPYHYEDVVVGTKTYKCIKTANGNNGFRCKTNDAGDVNATGSMQDNTNCPAAPVKCDEAKFDLSYTCMKGWTLDTCKADGYGILKRCGCDPAGSKAYPTMYTVTTCP